MAALKTNIGIRAGALFALFALGTATHASGRVQDVKITQLGGGVEITLIGKGITKPTTLWNKERTLFAIEVPAESGIKPTAARIDEAGVTTVKMTWTKTRPTRLRVEVGLSQTMDPKILQVDEGWAVAFGATSFIRTNDPTTAFIEAATTPTKPTEDAPKLPLVNERPNRVVVEDDLNRPQVDQPLNGPVAQNRPAPRANTPKPAPAAKPVGRVTLDFDNTDVTLILKAVAMQAGANIVTAPDLKGSVTVSLEKVTVEEALDLITALAGLRYTKVNETYVVAPRERFNDIVRSLNKSESRAAETRVVPIYSGEGEQIKAAVTRAFPQDTGKGSFDIILPSDNGLVIDSVNDEDEGDAKDQAASAAKAPPKNSPKDNLSQFYVMLVGNATALDIAEDLVKRVDAMLCEANGIKMPDTPGLTQDVYFIQSDTMSAQSLINSVTTFGGKMFRNLQFIPTPQNSDRQAIYIIGRSTDVKRAKDMLAQFDGSQDVVQMYDVRYSDPRALRDELQANVPGLRVTIPAASALSPKAYEAPPKKGGSAKGGEGEESGGGGGDQKAANIEIKGEKVDAEGITLPFGDLETVAKPMRLILRGTDEQIEKAMKYLAMVDIEPRQVAIDLRVMELSREDALRLGLDWSILTGGLVRDLRVNQGLGDTANTSGTVSASGSSGGTSGNVLGTLDQIANKRTLINRPNFLVIDGRESELFVGDVVRYIESIQSTQNGITVTTNSVRVGVRCAIHLRVGADGMIMMDLRPVVSYLRAFTPVPGGGNLPQTSERIAQSSLLMQSGETIALGGLIRDEDRKTVSGIPILKDLPIIGQLFKRTDNNRQRTEIVFFITAKLVDRTNRADAALPRANADRNKANDAMNAFPDPLGQEKKKRN